MKIASVEICVNIININGKIIAPLRRGWNAEYESGEAISGISIFAELVQIMELRIILTSTFPGLHSH